MSEKAKKVYNVLVEIIKTYEVEVDADDDEEAIEAAMHCHAEQLEKCGILTTVVVESAQVIRRRQR
jgi:hypothetical protein